MAEMLAKRRAQPAKKVSGPNVLIIEPRAARKGAANKPVKRTAKKAKKKLPGKRTPPTVTLKKKSAKARRAK
jgi:hypothetical protein